ncbi:MAG TPA: sigma-54 dependent transcriptional regulator [Polyangiaceae bacterium]|nr:sigma-54 dependent transcriptional regulator [Polyangiaceae bacterium]
MEAAGKGSTILVVDDDPSVRFAMCGALRLRGYRVLEADSCASATRALRERPAVVITDLRLPDGDALVLLGRARALDPDVVVFIVTGYGTIDLAVRAVKDGAEDFLTKPVNLAALERLVARSLRAKGSARGAPPRIAPKPAGAFVARSEAMLLVEDQVERLRSADCTVLLLGETGTGKSVLARRIHTIGARGAGPFVDLNCAGLTKDFVATELFGHERGAFTGAHASKAGLFEEASGGTLFLDELGDLDVQVQPKLLKVLEQKRFRRIGDVRERTADVRLIAATHVDLAEAVVRREFRADLYYRVNTVTIVMPALRDRRDDILPLSTFLLHEVLGAPGAEIAPDASRELLEYRWPGNLRELRSVLERALLHRSDRVIRAGDLRFDLSVPHLPPASPPARAEPLPAEGGPIGPLVGRTLAELEREHIERALRAEGGRVEAAARRLGMPRSTLYLRIKAYGLQTKAYGSSPSGFRPVSSPSSKPPRTA